MRNGLYDHLPYRWFPKHTIEWVVVFEFDYRWWEEHNHLHRFHYTWQDLVISDVNSMKSNNFVRQYHDEKSLRILNTLMPNRFVRRRIILLNREVFLLVVVDICNVEDIDGDPYWLYLMIQLWERNSIPNRIHRHEEYVDDRVRSVDSFHWQRQF